MEKETVNLTPEQIKAIKKAKENKLLNNEIVKK